MSVESLLRHAVPASRPAPEHSSRASLRLVPAGRTHARRAPFVLLLVALLGSGLAGLLVLSASLEQGSFRLSALQQQQQSLTDQEQSLNLDVQQIENPATLAAKAQALGMVLDLTPAFLELPSGLVLGDSPLAGTRVHLTAIPAGPIWLGPGGPPAPVVTPPPSPVTSDKTAKTAKPAKTTKAGTTST